MRKSRVDRTDCFARLSQCSFSLPGISYLDKSISNGHDLDTDIDPFQAGLEFALDWNSDFIGKSALLERRDQAPTGKLVSIVFDEIDARPLGNEPVRQAGRIIGKTTSAAFGYRLGKPVAIARLECKSENNLDGLKVDVDIARSQNAGTAFLNAAYDPRGSNMRASTR